MGGGTLDVVFPGLVARADVAPGEGRVRLALRPPKLLGEMVLPVADRRFAASTWRVGVIHVVVEVPGPELDRLPLERFAAATEDATTVTDPNVTLVAGSGERLRIRTRERGAGETLACGSAALAAAAWRGTPGMPVEVVPPGGTSLRVRVDGSAEAVLEGPARIVFRGTWAPFPA